MLEVLKAEEKVLFESEGGYFKTKYSMVTGKFYLTNQRLVFAYKKVNPLFFLAGLILYFIMLAVAKYDNIIEIDRESIVSAERGKHGIAKNVILIKQKDETVTKVLITNKKDVDAWISELNKK